MTEEKEVLKKEIGVRALALAVIGIVVGSGIYVIPALLADKLGATAILAYFTIGILVFLIALCFAEIGGKTNVSGGYVVPILAAAGIVWFLSNLKLNEIISFALFLLVLTIVYFIKNKFKKNKR